MPALLRTLLVFLLFIFIVFAFSTVVGYRTLTGYFIPLVLLSITWMLYRKEEKNLSAIGFDLKSRNLLFIPLGILIGIVFLTLTLHAEMLNEPLVLKLNPAVDYVKVANGVFFLLQGVLIEELIFRGYCLQKTRQQLGFWKANLLFAFLFVIWHWIAWDAWGNYLMMVTSITTAFGHFLFSTSFNASRTLYFPISIHLGINWASQNLFSLRTDSPGSDVMFIVTGGDANPSIPHISINIIITLVCYILLIAFIHSRRRVE